MIEGYFLLHFIHTERVRKVFFDFIENYFEAILRRVAGGGVDFFGAKRQTNIDTAGAVAILGR